MTNREKFKEEIFEIACSGDIIAVDKETNKPRKCGETSCCDCALKCKILSYSDALAYWLNSEYVEPCPFERDELVEVSFDGEDWSLRYFSHIDSRDLNEKFYAFINGKTSEETDSASGWKYCQKYGTLGGLVKGETEWH